MPAGNSFQNGYREQLEELPKQHDLDGSVQFVGQLDGMPRPGSTPCITLESFRPSTRKPWDCGR